MTLSVIIVHYQAKRLLLDCLQSIFGSKIKVSFEVIVVDNDEKPAIEAELKKKFPQVVYLPAGKNLGFGAANNLAVSKTKGSFLFFLNPDTIIQPQAIFRLVKFLETHPRAGIVAPLLLDKEKKPYSLQGTDELTPLRAVFGLSFLNKIWPNNPVSRKYWLADWDQKNPWEVAVVPGSALMVRRQAFAAVAGFDENFFLYFEESDLCQRIRKAGWQVFFEPWAKVIHLWVGNKEKDIEKKKIFQTSRFYFFRKHFGLISACLTEAFLRVFER